jgi:hypothetical protein
MDSEFRLIMISAMYENGGNTTQRFLDGHPELFSYPFESQPGSKYVNDYLSSTFPLKYRWPVFPLDQDTAADYETIIDEECKVRIKTPQSSKFRDYPMELSDVERKKLFVTHMHGKPRTRANLMEAFFRSSAAAWKDYRKSGRERGYVGYSPIIVVDADKIVKDLPHGHVLQIIRNPWSAYADTKKRAVPLSLAHYITGWCLNQTAALTYQAQFPGRVHLLRFEDIIVDPQAVLGKFLTSIGFSTNTSLSAPTWNGQQMNQVYPWGTIRQPTPAANRATAEELSSAEKEEIRIRASALLDRFGYTNFLTAAKQAA